MTAEFTRRNLFKIGGLAAAGLGGAALLGACSPTRQRRCWLRFERHADCRHRHDHRGRSRARGASELPGRAEPITDIAETKDYDVVVVGAGASGVPAAITAREAGATVALIQKESTASPRATPLRAFCWTLRPGRRGGRGVRASSRTISTAASASR